MNLLISVQWHKDILRFSLISEPEDSSNNARFNVTNSFEFRLRGNSVFPKVHPDRLALVAILNVLPFAGKRIYLDWNISQKFLDATKVITRVRIESKKSDFSPIKRLIDGSPALSFSGGADSMAALAVMPMNTEPVFMSRYIKKIKTLYDSEAAEQSCQFLSNLGYSVQIVESDFEYLRDPLGFPTDVAVGSPIILLGEFRNYDTISFGTILESSYGTSGKSYRDYTKSSHFRLWNSLFEVVGFGYSLPVAGISEVGTSLILHKSPFGRIHQSCIRGKWKLPCSNCWKCFRKGVVDSSITNGILCPKSKEMILSSKEVRARLIGDKPIKHEGVLTYALSKIKTNDKTILALKDLVRVGKISVIWMERWYPHSSSLIDQSYRKYSCDLLSKYLGQMESIDIKNLVNWSNINDEDREFLLAKFSKLLPIL